MTSIKRINQNSLNFKISESMAKQFSGLTGDLNPLHIDDEFARKTSFRQPIVQGMLLAGYLIFLDELLRPGKICIPLRLKAQFMEPVFFDQLLSLEMAPQEIEPATEIGGIEFQVKHAEDHTIAAKGRLEVRYARSMEGRDKDIHEIDSSCMAIDRPELKSHLVEDISVGEKEKFRFKISNGNINYFLNILREGLENKSQADPVRLKREFHISNMMACMLLSTSVGMFNPGKFATFLDFDVSFPIAVVLEEALVFNGIIRNVSASTRMIKKEVSILPNKAGVEEVLMKGYVHALINQPPAAMPDILELERSSKELGLEGKVALVTGSSRGIGETIAKLLALQGAKVVINYFKGESDALRVVREIEHNGGEAIAVGADVRSQEQVLAMIETVAKAFGAIDILVNNAVRDFKPSSFEKVSWKHVQEDIDVIVKGAFNCCKAVLPMMVAERGGKIINMGTVATENPPINQAKYVVAKSALVGLTRALSIEYAPKNIQVNMVVPHFVATDLVAHIPAPYRQKMVQEIPMKRAASAVDVAKTVAFLASSYADFITGQKVMVTGGGAPYA